MAARSRIPKRPTKVGAARSDPKKASARRRRADNFDPQDHQPLSPEEEALLYVARKLEEEGTFFVSELVDEVHQLGCVEAEYKRAMEGHHRGRWLPAQRFLREHPDPLASPTLRKWLVALRTLLRDNPSLASQRSPAAEIFESFLLAFFQRPARHRGRPIATLNAQLQDQRSQRIVDFMERTLTRLKERFDQDSDLSSAADVVPAPTGPIEEGDWPWPRNCWGDRTNYRSDLDYFLRAVLSREMSIQEAAATWLARTEPILGPDPLHPVEGQSPLEDVRLLRERIRGRDKRRRSNKR